MIELGSSLLWSSSCQCLEQQVENALHSSTLVTYFWGVMVHSLIQSIILANKHDNSSFHPFIATGVVIQENYWNMPLWLQSLSPFYSCFEDTLMKQSSVLDRRWWVNMLPCLDWLLRIEEQVVYCGMGKILALVVMMYLKIKHGLTFTNIQYM
jgi:hypothetical protein